MRIGLKYITPMLAAGAAAVAIGAAPIAAAAPAPAQPATVAAAPTVEAAGWHGGGWHGGGWHGGGWHGGRLARRWLARWLGALVPSVGLALVSGRQRARSRSCRRGLDHADRAPPAVVAMANIHQRHSALTWDWRGGPSPDAQGWGATR